MRTSAVLHIVALFAAATVVLTGCAPRPEVLLPPLQAGRAPAPAPTTGLRDPMDISAPSPPSPKPTSTGLTIKSERPKPPRPGEKAPDFTLNDLDGKAVSLSDFRGKVVLISFWASWCGPCRVEIPHMIKVYDELRDQGFEILAVNLREDSGRVRAFVSEYDMRFPILLDPQGKVGGAYFVRGIPTSVFVDREGIITAVHTGSLTDTALRRYVNDLMQ